jgi:hypothetical protein
MSNKTNDKLPILLSSVTLVIVVILLIFLIFRGPGKPVIIPTATTTISQSGQEIGPSANSSVILSKGHVSSLTSFFGVYDVEFNASSGQTVSGAFSSTRPLDFYIMTPAEYQTYIGDVPLDSLISDSGEVWDMFGGITYLDNLILPSYNGTVSNYSVTGAFESNRPTTFYILTPSEYSNYDLYDQINGYVYATPSGFSSEISINARIKPGAYYFVLYSPGAGYNDTTFSYHNTTAIIEMPITVSPEYSLASIYNSTQSENNSFTAYLPSAGPYYLVWEYDNASGGGAALQVTKTIKLN